MAGDRSTPAQALEALRAAGVVGSEAYELKARLTEGDVVRVSQRMELDLVSESPGREFSSRQTDTFFEVFGPVLAAAAHGANSDPGPDHDRNPNAADPRERGRGRKVGLSAHFPFP